MKFATMTAAAALTVAAFAGGAHAACDDPSERGCKAELELDLNGLGGLDLSNVTVTAPEVNIEPSIPGDVTNAIELNQSNKGNVEARVNANIDRMTDHVVESTAIANTASVEVTGSLALEAEQWNGGNVNSTANATLTNQSGHPEVRVTAIGNALNAVTDAGAYLAVVQLNEGEEVTGRLNANITDAGITEITTEVTAIANTFSLEHNGALIGSIEQKNCADVTAINNTSVAPPPPMMPPRVDPNTATAIANAISITRRAAP